MSILIQVAYSLAVAEKVLKFEHRDLHWGNILIHHKSIHLDANLNQTVCKTCQFYSNANHDDDFIQFCLNDRIHRIKQFGVNASIIDFTLSRLEQGDDQCYGRNNNINNNFLISFYL